MDLLTHRLRTEIQSNNYRGIKHWYDFAQQQSFEEVLDAKTAGKLINSVARFCDPISINEFLKLAGLKIEEIVVDWPAVLRHATLNPSTLVLTIFIDACRRKLTDIKLAKTLKTVDIKGSLLHCILEGGNLTSLKYMFDVLQEELPESDFKDVLLSTKKEVLNLIAQTVALNDKVGFKLILALLRRHIDRQSLRTMLITSEKGANILVESLANPSMVYFVFQKLQEELGVDDPKSMLLQIDPLDNDSNVLHRYFRSGMKIYMCFVLDFLESVLDHKDISSLLCASTNYDNNIVHVAFINASGSNIELIFQFLRKYVGQDKLRELLCDETKHGSKVFHIAVKKTTVNFLSRIYDQLVSEFGDNSTANELLLADNRFKQNILYIAARMGLPSYFPHIIDFIRSKSSDECVKQMALQLDENGENLLHAAARNPSPTIFSTVLTCLQTYCGESTVRSLLRATARNRYNIFHFVVRSDGDLLPIYEFCESMFGTHEAKRMLFANATRNQNVLQIAARFGASFRSIFGWLKALLTASEFHNLLTLNNRPADTVFIACVEFDHYDGLKEIFECYLEEIGLDSLKSALSAPEFMHVALSRVKNVKALNCLLDQLVRFLDVKTISGWLVTFDPLSLGSDKEEVSKYLATQIDISSFKSATGEFRNKVLHMTIHTGDADMLGKLLKYMERLRPKLLGEATRARLKNGDNIGHSVIRTRDTDMIAAVFEYLEGCKILGESVLETNMEGLNVVDLAAESGSEDVFRLVLDVVEKLDVQTREKLIDRSNIFHSIAREFENTIVNKAFGIFFRDMTPEVITGYFDTQNRHGSYLFETCILRGNFRSIPHIWTGLGPKILQISTKNKENVFHLAARSGNAKMLNYILKRAEEVLSPEEVEALLTAVDASGSNILHMIALKNDEKLMESSIEMLNQELGVDKVKEMVATENHLGSSVGKILNFFGDDLD
jgi:hypothetical protein